MPMTTNTVLPVLERDLSAADYRALLEDQIAMMAEDLVLEAFRGDHPLAPDRPVGVRVLQQGPRVKLVVATSSEPEHLPEAYVAMMLRDWGWRRWGELDELARLAVKEQMAEVMR